jgi:hypothetical protein
MKKRTKKFNDGGMADDGGMAKDGMSGGMPGLFQKKEPYDSYQGPTDVPALYEGTGSSRRRVHPFITETGKPADHAQVIAQHMRIKDMPDDNPVKAGMLQDTVKQLKESAGNVIKNEQFYKDKAFSDAKEARAQATKPRTRQPYAKGGAVKSAASSRGDGCAVKGKTKGRMV